jgi:uncharacterized membrane protein YkoI
MNKRIYTGVAVLAAAVVGTAGIATASNGASSTGSAPEQETIHAPDSSGSRLDDGANLLPQAQITEAQAIRAAQTAASGPLNEVDLEDYQGHLVFNVDVGSHDVKVDASNGNVLAAPVDD